MARKSSIPAWLPLRVGPDPAPDPTGTGSAPCHRERSNHPGNSVAPAPIQKHSSQQSQWGHRQLSARNRLDALRIARTNGWL
jgi:hypothetical protein